MDAAIYVRISRDQKGDGLGVARQEQDCRELAARHKDWNVHEVYSDNDISAYSGKVRPAYQRMLAAIEAGEVQAIVAWHPDRLHRSPKELERFIDVVDAAKCKVQTVQAGTVDLTTPTGRMTARIIGAVARQESEHKAERQKRAFQQMREAGRRHGGRTFGYTRAMEVIPEEAAIIREAAERALAGESVYSITKDLIERGVPTVRGGHWKDVTLRGMLIHAVISGRFEHSLTADGRRRSGRTGAISRVEGPGKWEAIISPEDSDRLRALLGHSHRVRGRNPEYLLTGGIAVCGRCGSRLYAAVGYSPGKRGLVCLSAPGGGAVVGCGKLGIYAEPVEENVSEAVLQAIDTGALSDLLEDSTPTIALEELAGIERKLQEFADDYAQDLISRAELDAGRARLRARQKDLSKELETSRRQLGLVGLPDGLREAWTTDKLTLVQKRAIIKALVEAVVIHPFQPRYQNNAERSRSYRERKATGTPPPASKFNPGRIEIRWRA